MKPQFSLRFLFALVIFVAMFVVFVQYKYCQRQKAQRRNQAIEMLNQLQASIQPPLTRPPLTNPFFDFDPTSVARFVNVLLTLGPLESRMILEEFAKKNPGGPSP